MAEDHTAARRDRCRSRPAQRHHPAQPSRSCGRHRAPGAASEHGAHVDRRPVIGMPMTELDLNDRVVEGRRALAATGTANADRRTAQQARTPGTGKGMASGACTAEDAPRPHPNGTRSVPRLPELRCPSRSRVGFGTGRAPAGVAPSETHSNVEMRMPFQLLRVFRPASGRGTIGGMRRPG